MKELSLMLLLVSVIACKACAAEPAPIELCSAQADTARVVMTARQRGMSMQQVYPRAATAVAKNLVRLAYLQPRAITLQQQDAVAAEFANDFYMMCVNTYEGRE